MVLNFLDYYALPVDDSRVGNDSDSEQNSDEEENSVTSSDNSNSEEEEEKTEKFVRRGSLKWRVPRYKYIKKSSELELSLLVTEFSSPSKFCSLSVSLLALESSMFS